MSSHSNLSNYQLLIFTTQSSRVHFCTLSRFELITLRIYITYKLHPFQDCTCKWRKSFHTDVLQSLASSLQRLLGYPEWKPDSCPSPRHQTSTYAREQPDVTPFFDAQYLEFHPRERSGRPQTESTIGDSGGSHHLKDTAGAPEEEFLWWDLSFSWRNLSAVRSLLRGLVSNGCVDRSRKGKGGQC